MLVDRSRLHSDPGAALAQTKAIAPVHRPDRPGSGLPDRQHLEHAPGREGRRRRGQADVPLPRPAGRPAGRLPRRLCRQHPRQRAAARAGHPAPPRCAPRSSAADAPLPDAGPRRRRLHPRGRARIPVRDGDPRAGNALRRLRPRTWRCPRSSAIAVGMLTTAFALYVPGRRSLQSRGQPGAAGDGRGSRARVAHAGGSTSSCWRWPRSPRSSPCAPAPSTPEPGSVYEGQSASLPSHLLLAPMVAWVGGMLLAVRVFEAIAVAAPGARAAPIRPADPRHPEPQPEEALLGVRHRDSSASAW